MCDNWLERYREASGEVSPNVIAIKIPGRLRVLREAWAEHRRDVRAKPLAQSYERLQMDETLAWFDGIPAGTTHVDIDEIMRRVETVQVAAIAIRDAAREAGA
jgi:hypothetical protein